MRRVPKGKLITSDRIRAHLAVNFGADGTCPLTAGIFINTAAQASLERGTDETPFWRTLKKDGELNEKYPRGSMDKSAALNWKGIRSSRRASGTMSRTTRRSSLCCRSSVASGRLYPDASIEQAIIKNRPATGRFFAG
jgi:hypothetical protein